jgi:hypothetical protein
LNLTINFSTFVLFVPFTLGKISSLNLSNSQFFKNSFNFSHKFFKELSVELISQLKSFLIFSSNIEFHSIILKDSFDITSLRLFFISEVKNISETFSSQSLKLFSSKCFFIKVAISLSLTPALFKAFLVLSLI